MPKIIPKDKISLLDKLDKALGDIEVIECAKGGIPNNIGITVELPRTTYYKVWQEVFEYSQSFFPNGTQNLPHVTSFRIRTTRGSIITFKPAGNATIQPTENNRGVLSEG